MPDGRSRSRTDFEEQALAHMDLLYRYSLSLRGNAADADDLVQETYLKAYRFWHTYDQGTNVRAWLFRIMKNSFINMYRKRKSEPATAEYSESTLPDPSLIDAAGVNNFGEALFDNLLGDEVVKAISKLSLQLRTVVILRDIEGMTYGEIAQFLHCPLGTVRSRLHRGRRELQSGLCSYAKDRGYVLRPGDIG
jgi:RNA polymerase sigma-70 factor, ECF subfamily